MSNDVIAHKPKLSRILLKLMMESMDFVYIVQGYHVDSEMVIKMVLPRLLLTKTPHNHIEPHKL